MNTLNNNIPRKWARYSPNGYEVSSKGDKRYSAFYAKLKSFGNISIETVYQKLKGSGKGKPSPHPNFEYWNTYLSLWKEWAKENPELIKDLIKESKGKTLTDMFATTNNNQARALAQIISNYEN